MVTDVVMGISAAACLTVERLHTACQLIAAENLSQIHVAHRRERLHQLLLVNATCRADRHRQRRAAVPDVAFLKQARQDRAGLSSFYL